MQNTQKPRFCACLPSPTPHHYRMLALHGSRGGGHVAYDSGCDLSFKYFYSVEWVTTVTCLLLGYSYQGEILLDGVLSKAQAFKPTHRIVSSQPGELHIIAIVSPWQTKASLGQCKGTADVAGLGNATECSKGSILMVLSLKGYATQELARFLKCGRMKYFARTMFDWLRSSSMLSIVQAW